MAKKGDGTLAWAVLRRVGEYREAWRRHAASASAASESGPFPIRVQTEADLEAARFEMLAWEDPFVADGPATPFWCQNEMPEAVLDPAARPLVSLAGEDGSVEGLRLLRGDMVLKVECGSASVQVRLRETDRFPADGGISVMHPFGLRMPHSMRRMLDFWSVTGRTAPRNGRARRNGSAGGVCETCRLVTVLDGLAAGRSARGIAEDVWGAEEVANTWTPDGWMRSQVRRWIPKARALADGGWREFVPRNLPGH